MRLARGEDSRTGEHGENEMRGGGRKEGIGWIAQCQVSISFILLQGSTFIWRRNCPSIEERR